MTTQLNTYINSAKLNAIEVASDLHMIVRDLEKFREDQEAMNTISLDYEGMYELIENVKAMAGSATFLSKEIGERLDRLIRKESMKGLRSSSL